MSASRGWPMRMVLAALLIVVGSGGASDALAAPPPINKQCVVMPEEEVDPAFTVIYKGQTVGFCCKRCRSKFRADPEKYAGRLTQLAVAMAPAGRDSPAEAVEDRAESPSESPAPAAVATPGLHQHPGQQAEDSGGATEGSLETGDTEERAPLPGRLHPAIVHFPLAGIPLAFLGFLVWVLTGRSAFAKADVPPLAVGALAAVAAVLTGNIAYDTMGFSASMNEIAERHQLVATVVMVLTLILLALRIWRWNRLLGPWRLVYGGGLFVASAMLGFTGFLGGSLVFGPGHLAW